ncbi:Uncharacterised protein [Mannheimia haemolytica]|uniref:Uncharacterized protein n=1 Tax=Mannheimia haemolytica TaxID=75985 RepID=A0A378N584_MANHA|nr:Uncharacterised protein [Mannheimia haemolytica]
MLLLKNIRKLKIEKPATEAQPATEKETKAEETKPEEAKK